MGNSSSAIRQHLYVLKVANADLPLCPFIHTIIGFNGAPVLDTDPRIFRDILTREDLVFEVMDIRDNTVFTVCIPQGTAKLGINVVKLTANIAPLNVRVTNVREGSPFLMGDQILGVENVYLSDEDQLVAHIKDKVGAREVLVLMRGEQIVAEEIDVCSDMGCEIGMGILFKPHVRECYMRDYNGRVARHPKDSMDGRDHNIAHPEVNNNSAAGPSDVNGGESSGNADAGPSLASGVGAASPAEEGALCDNSTHVQMAVEPENHAEEDAMEEQGPDFNVGSVEEGLSGLGLAERASETERGVVATAVQGGASSASRDSAPSNRICEEAGQVHEAECVRGEKRSVSEGAVIINDTFADRNDFIRDDGRLRMKSDAFERRREAYQADSIALRHAEEKKGTSLDNAPVSPDGDAGGTPSEKTSKAIFESNSDDAELPFEKSEGHFGVDARGATEEEGHGSATPVRTCMQSFRAEPSQHRECGPQRHAAPRDPSVLGGEEPASGQVLSSHSVSAIINDDDSKAAYDEWDRISHAKSEPAPVNSGVFEVPQSVDADLQSYTESCYPGSNATVLPVVFEDVPPGFYQGRDPRAVSNPALERLDVRSHSPDPREPTSDSEIL